MREHAPRRSLYGLRVSEGSSWVGARMKARLGANRFLVYAGAVDLWFLVRVEAESGREHGCSGSANDETQRHMLCVVASVPLNIGDYIVCDEIPL